MSRTIVTTSWDDGHKLDMRLAGLLRKYNLPATFYVAPKNQELGEANTLTPEEIIELSNWFEIGSHTLTHPTLTKLTPDQLAAEVHESRQYLRQLTGQEVTAFCYPRGMYNNAVVQTVAQAGYTYARTMQRFAIGPLASALQAPTALEAHRGPLPKVLSDVAALAAINNGNLLKAVRCLDWEVQAKTLFDRALAQGGTFHLWGHSWVVDKWKDWAKLERVLAYIANRPEADYRTNSQLSEAA